MQATNTIRQVGMSHPVLVPVEKGDILVFQRSVDKAQHIRGLKNQNVPLFIAFLLPYSARTSILRGRTSARLGMRTLSTPSFRLASI
jgi:hypothetical protein